MILIVCLAVAWAVPLAAQEDGDWRVVPEPNIEIGAATADGTPMAMVRMPDTVRPLEIRGDRILGLATDELRVERVVVHRIEGRSWP